MIRQDLIQLTGLSRSDTLDMKLVCLLVCLGVWCSAVHAVDYDAIVDKIVDGIKQKLIEENKTKIPLPNFQRRLQERVLFFPVESDLTMSGIQVMDFSTIRRFGSIMQQDVQANNDNNTIRIAAVLSMDYLMFSVDDFKYDFSLMHINTPVDFRINANKFYFNVDVHLNRTANECSSELDLMMVNHLGDFVVSIGDTGFFSFAPVEERIDAIIMDWFAQSLAEEMDRYIKPFIHQVVGSFSQEICRPFL